MRPILRPYTSAASGGGATEPEITWPVDAAPDTLRDEPAPDTLREGPMTPREPPRGRG